jgi:hypothetical protein
MGGRVHKGGNLQNQALIVAKGRGCLKACRKIFSDGLEYFERLPHLLKDSNQPNKDC